MFLFFVDIFLKIVLITNSGGHFFLLLSILVQRWKYSSVYSNGVEIKERLEVVKVSIFSMYNIFKEIP